MYESNQEFDGGGGAGVGWSRSGWSQYLAGGSGQQKNELFSKFLEEADEERELEEVEEQEEGEEEKEGGEVGGGRRRKKRGGVEGEEGRG